MASFCRPCTSQMAGPEHAHQNDMAGAAQHAATEMLWMLCEGCGWHAFDNSGDPICGPPLPDFNYPLHLTTIEPCKNCRRITAQQFATGGYHPQKEGE